MASSPRPMDQSKANPVLYREKGNLRSSSPRCLTPNITKANFDRSLTVEQEVLMENDNKRQEIILNIPQQQRDDDEKTDINSRSTSVANLDNVVSQEENSHSKSNDILDTGKTEVANISQRKQEISTVESEPQNKSESLNDQSNKRELMMPNVDENGTEGAALRPSRPSSLKARFALERNDTKADSVTWDEGLEDDFDDVKTVPDVDSEIQAVLLANNSSGAFDMTQDSVDIEVAQRNARAIAASGGGAGGNSAVDGNHALSMSDINGPVLRGKTCTPASVYTEVSELKFIDDGRSSHGPETKEAMYQEAISLMDERCVSRDSSRMMAQIDHRYRHTPHPPDAPPLKPGYAKSIASSEKQSVVALRDNMETPLIGVKHHPYGRNTPERIYVLQRKPTPMKPLPAWKGYYGNVYFAPISVQPAKVEPAPHPPEPNLDQCSEQLQNILLRNRRVGPRSRSVSSKRTTDMSLASLSTTSTNPRNSATSRKSAIKRSQSVASVRSRGSVAFSKASTTASRPAVLLDKRSVLTNFNENIADDIDLISRLESTGSLILMQNELDAAPQEQLIKKQTVHFEKDKIRKSSLAQRTQSAKQSKHQYPELGVSGGQCDRPKENSQALIRSRSHNPFYKYNRQPYKNTPESNMYPQTTFNSLGSSLDKLPPLEQLKATLRRMENGASKEELIRMVPTSGAQKRAQSVDLKRTPYVKFSPEFRNPHPPSRNISVK